MIRAYRDKHPKIHERAFVAETAVLIGDVTLEEDSSVWYGAVIRADSAPIVIGKGANVQDGAVLHCDPGYPMTLGEGVTIGHSAVVHGAQVGENVVVGMHATLLNGCVIGENSIIGAGALVKEGQVIPPASLAVGVPAKVVRTLSPEQYEGNRENAAHYSHLAKEYGE